MWFLVVGRNCGCCVYTSLDLFRSILLHPWIYINVLGHPRIVCSTCPCRWPLWNFEIAIVSRPMRPQHSKVPKCLGPCHPGPLHLCIWNYNILGHLCIVCSTNYLQRLAILEVSNGDYVTTDAPSPFTVSKMSNRLVWVWYDGQVTAYMTQLKSGWLLMKRPSDMDNWCIKSATIHTHWRLKIYFGRLRDAKVGLEGVQI